jgi:hypothetical protein
MQNLMKLWSIRKLSVLGRVTVLKTLIIPKITYLLIALPNPPKHMIQTLKTMFFKFIWQNKPEKVKRDVLVQDYKYGGLKIPNIVHLVTSLKATWIQRIFRQSTKWITLFESTTNLRTKDLVIYGDYFLEIKKEKVTNMFWKDVLCSWALVQKNQKLQNTEDIQGLNIWYNTNILLNNKPFIYKNFINKGVIFISDILDEEGDFLTFESFTNKYNINTHFLNYASLINAVKAFVHTQTSLTVTEFITIKIPILPFKLTFLLNKNTTSKVMYNILNSKITTPKSQTKYASKGLVFDHLTWTKYYVLPFKCLKDTTLIWFQYRLLHRILATNTFLYMINYSDSNKCTFCNKLLETLQHLFYDCDKVRELWKSLETWIFHKTGFRISLTKNIVIFGMIDDKLAQNINWLIINIKYYIYTMKILKRNLCINTIKVILQKKFQIEKYIYFKNCEYDKFNNNWSKWLNLLE